jgi:aminoglycoside phosphotransferase (APT) family kinase protein
MTRVDEVEVVVAHQERATLRVGDVFLKVDADHERIDHEVEAMALAPVPTPEVRWRNPPVLALGALRGSPLGVLDDPSVRSSAAAWAATGAALRAMHEAPLPPWPGKSVDELRPRFDAECSWLVAEGVLSADQVECNRWLAEPVFRLWTPAFIHGDLHIAHVFVDGDELTGIIDWSEAAQGDPLYDLATLTLGHRDRLEDLLAGYGPDADRGVIRAWWSYRCAVGIRWLAENGYGSPSDFGETAVLRSLAATGG